MATIKATIRTNRASRKTGECKIEIAISHRTATKFFPTPYSVLPEYFKNGVVSKKVPDYIMMNADISRILSEWDEKLRKVENHNFYDLDTLILLATSTKSSQERKLLTFKELLKIVQDELKEEGKSEKYISMLDRSYDVFKAYCPRDVLVCDINSAFVIAYQRWMLNKRKLSRSTTNMYLSHLKMCLNRAIRYGWVKYEQHPFTNTKIGKSDVKNNWMDTETLRSYRDMQLSGMKNKARDMFMLSFYLGGANLIDLLSIQYDLSSLYIEYVRRKVRNRVRQVVQVPLCHEAKEIIAKYIDKDKRINLDWKGEYETQLRNISKNISKVIPKCSIYSARKTFSQAGRECNADMTVVDYLLGHSDTSQGVIRHYVRPEFKVSAITMRKILDYVANPTDIDDEYRKVMERL